MARIDKDTIIQRIRHLDWLRFYAKNGYLETKNKAYLKEVDTLSNKINKQQELYKKITGNYLDLNA